MFAPNSKKCWMRATVTELHPAREYSVPENAQLKITPAIMGEFIQRFCENVDPLWVCYPPLSGWRINRVSIRFLAFYDLFYEKKIIEVKVLLWSSRRVGKCCECIPQWFDYVPLWLPECTCVRWNPGSGSCAFQNSFTAYRLRALTSVNTHWLCFCSRAWCTSARQLES